MTFSKRWNPKAKPLQCKQCGMRDAIVGRKDKLCTNCAHYPDKARAEQAKRRAAVSQ